MSQIKSKVYTPPCSNRAQASIFLKIVFIYVKEYTDYLINHHDLLVKITNTFIYMVSKLIYLGLFLSSTLLSFASKQI